MDEFDLSPVAVGVERKVARVPMAIRNHLRTLVRAESVMSPRCIG